MATPAASEPTAGLPSPSDPRLAAALAVIWKHGLFPSLVAVAFAYLLYSLAGTFTRQLEAVDRRLDAHQSSMEQSDAARALSLSQQNLRLKGICYGVTKEGSPARAFCDGTE